MLFPPSSIGPAYWRIKALGVPKMSENGKSIRDSLAGKDLIGFTSSAGRDGHAIERASSAKVTTTKAPKSPTEDGKTSSERT